MSRAQARNATHPAGPVEHDAGRSAGARRTGAHRRRSPWGRRILAAAVACAVVALGGVVAAFTMVDLPSAVPMMRASVLYDSDGTTELARLGVENRTPVKLSAVPPVVRHAVLAAEDRGFYGHWGLSWRGLARALVSNVTSDGSTQGASTITQQYVKNTYLGQERTAKRKIKEAVLSVKIERRLSKDEILEGYLNTIYFGRGAYGIDAAAKTYFGVRVEDLRPEQGAVLAAIIKSPTGYDPERSRPAAEARWRYVLTTMADAGWLSSAEAKDAKYPAITPEHSSLTGPAGYVVAQVEHELRAQGITDQELRTEGLRIVTTIDRDAQAAATAAMRAALGRAAADTRGALVSIQPGTGAIRAYYGGDRGYGFLDYARGSYPSGGTLRPFVSAATILGADTEDSARGGSGGRGARAALSLATSAGIRKSAAGQKEIDAKDPHESADSVLSRYPVSPVELAAGMGTLAAGVRGDPHLVRSVQQGRATVYENQARGHRVDGPLSVSVIRTSGLYRKDSDWQALLPGGRWSSGNLGVVQAGPAKAQTSSTAWAAGLTPELSTAIWLGHDKNRPLLAKSGGPLDSRQTALTAWQAFAVHAGPGHQ
ncbi:MAG: hypothetical protein QOJ50_2859 [Cryptosporangiaceae bacterium]|nr:hypothetical protein [Cryptosporangiaceae bacterium]